MQPTANRDSAIGVILQARIASTRLPGKVLLPFGGTTLLGWIVRRLKELPWPIVVATSTEPQDSAIEEHCSRDGVMSFRGSELDVLDRYYHCMIMRGFTDVIRLTGDNPFPDVQEIVNLVSLHCAGRFDYSHSFGELPVGVGAEVLSGAALTESWREGWSPKHREHVNEYILDHPHRFNIGVLSVAPGKRSPATRLTIDTDEDYRRLLRCVDGGLDRQMDTEALIAQCSPCA